jgi:uncharacterized repeat protein (TIGR01451 family)
VTGEARKAPWSARVRRAEHLAPGAARRFAWRVALLALLGCAAAAGEARAQIVRAFTPRFSANQPGDIVLVGNTVMTCTGGGNCTNGRNGNGGQVDDNDFNMVYVDVDGDATTFSSSSATLALPPGTSVLWAGLYWGGYTNNGQRTQVRLATPATGYVAVNASRLDASGQAYQGFADVTADVQAGGSGTYQVANVRSTPNTTNVHGGWALVVVYSDPTQPPRNLVVYDGYANVAGNTAVNITVNGFVTPPAGVVNTKLGAVVYEGDLGLTGDSFQLNGTSLSDANNPATNFFNSSISSLGARVTTKNPDYVNQLGFDIDLVNAAGLLPNSATSATIRLGTNGDTYYPGVVTFATDLYAPVFDAANFTKTVTDLNGGVTRPGDVLEYTLTMKNNGQDHATQCVLRDTLPANVTYVAGSLQVASGPNTGAKTDPSGDDVMEYLAASRSVVARLGTGANATTGGQLDIGVSTSITFRVTINAGTPAGASVSNQGWLSFRGAQSGSNFSAPSDGDPATPGAQYTTLVVAGGVALTGSVYADASHDGAKQAGETGTGVALWAKLFAAAGGNALQVVAVSPATGAYAFTFVTPGTYRVIRDTSNDPADATATDPAGWVGTQVPAGSRANVVVGTADVNNQDFGLWQGSSVSGQVFRDDGAGGGTANDGVRQAGEAAIAGVRMRLAAGCAGGACDSALTDAAGAFTLWLPLSGASGTAVVSEVNPSGTLSTGGGAGTTGGTYARAADAVSFAAATGQSWSGLAFGDVPLNTWIAPGAQTVASGGVAFYAHTYRAASAGGVSVSATESPSPALAGWSVQLFRDTNCNGTVDAGEPLLAPADVVNLVAGQSLCVVARHAAPAGAPAGASELATLTASFTYTGASPALQAGDALGDVTTVAATSGLVITKSVDRASAQPGDLLTYTITFLNPGAAALSNIVIRDATPAWTVFDSGACAATGAGITGCTLSAPGVGASGAVTWTLTGALAPGGSGSVSYRVRVQ